MKPIKSFLKEKGTLTGILISFYFLLLMLGSIIPSLRYGTTIGGINSSIIYRGAIFALFAILIFILGFKFKKAPRLSFLVFSLIFILFGIVSIFVTANDSVKLENSTKIAGVFSTIAIAITLYGFIEVVPVFVKKNSLLIFLNTIILFGIIASFYSLIAEWSVILNAFRATGEDSHFYQISSFFESKNLYGFILFISLISILIIYFLIKKNKRNILIEICLSLFLFINLIISRSKAALGLYVLIMLFFLVRFCIIHFKNKKKMICLILGIGLTIISVLMIVVFVPSIYGQSQFLTNLNNYIKEAYFGQARRSIENRIYKLNSIKSLIFTPRIIIGYGEQTLYKYIEQVFPRTIYLNAYMHNLISGGLFKIGLMVLIYFYIFKNIVVLRKHIFKKPKTLYLLFLIITISFIVLGLMENWQVLGSNFETMFILMVLFVIPTCICNKQITIEE